MEVVDYRVITHLQRRPLRVVEGVIHKWSGLIPIQHRQVVDVVVDGHALDLEESVGAAMHPASVVGLHLQGVGEGVHERMAA